MAAEDSSHERPPEAVVAKTESLDKVGSVEKAGSREKSDNSPAKVVNSEVQEDRKPGCLKNSDALDAKQRSDVAGTGSTDAQQQPAVAGTGLSGSTLASDPGCCPRVIGVDTNFAPWVFLPPVNSTGASGSGSRPDLASLPPPMVPLFLHTGNPSFCQAPLQEQNQLQGGVYAVPLFPYVGPLSGYPPGGLIPLSLNFPLGPPSPDAPSTTATPAAGQAEDGRGAPAQREVAAQGGLRYRPGAAGRAARPDIPRQVVRRFQVGFQLDLFLIMKLAVVVVVFNHDGSKDRLALLLFLAAGVYLYQTGALAPLLRWISQSAQRAMMPPPPAAPVVQAAPAVEANGAEPVQANPAAGNPPPGDNPEADPGQHLAVAQAEGEGGGGAAEERPDQAPGPNWWGFLKEVQMVVVGFVTSLLPGYQHIE